MPDVTRTAHQLAPLLASPAFETAFNDLAVARMTCEDAPRDASDVGRLAEASARLADGRANMRVTLHGRRVS